MRSRGTARKKTHGITLKHLMQTIYIQRFEAGMHPITFIIFHIYYFISGEAKGCGVGVECGGWMVTALLYADDAVLMAEDAKQAKRGLKVLEE